MIPHELIIGILGIFIGWVSGALTQWFIDNKEERGK